MEKAFKILLIVLAAWFGLVVLYFVFRSILNVFDFIEDNYIVILVIVIIISGLILLMSEGEDNSSIRTIAGVILFISVISLIGSFLGNLMAKGIGSFFK